MRIARALRLGLACAAALFSACSLVVSTDDLATGARADGGGPETAAGEASATDASASDGAPGDGTPGDGAPGDGGPCLADVSSDPFNCGRCAHGCAGAACARGQCTPQYVAASASKVFDVAVDDTSFYVSNNLAGPAGAISAGPKNGSGSAAPLVSSLDSPQRVKVLGGRLFWTSYDGAWTIHTCDVSRCSASATVVAQAGYEPDFAQGGDQLFFSDWDNGFIYACPVTGCAGPARVVAQGENRPWAIATDATNLYWTAIADDVVGAARVRGCPLGGCGVPRDYRSGLTTPLSLMADAARLYWIGRTNAPDAGGRTVVSSCASAQCETSAVDFSIPNATAGAASRLFVDANDVIWGDGATGEIYRCPVPTCTGGAAAMASGRKGISAITADASFVYFADDLGLWRVAR